MTYPRQLRGAFARLGFVAALAFAPGLARADEAAPVQCAPIEKIRASATSEPGGRWIALTDVQRAFLAGIYAMNPQTPPGLPVGDKAALATIGPRGGMIFFLDGDRACSPMPAPEELIVMLRQIGAGEVTHPGQGL